MTELEHRVRSLENAVQKLVTLVETLVLKVEGGNRTGEAEDDFAKQVKLGRDLARERGSPDTGYVPPAWQGR